jgi:hypothetical protein
MTMDSGLQDKIQIYAETLNQEKPADKSFWVADHTSLV